MSHDPKIGGKLREETSGVGRSQAVLRFGANDPVKEIGQTCVFEREAPSDLG